MTLLLAHPEAETLGRFVEGTLDDPERATIVQHIADCDDCRILVVDAAEFIEAKRTESSHWWIGIAASLLLVAGLGTFTYNHFRDPLASVEKRYGELKYRPVEGRLSQFQYVPLKSATRGAADEDNIEEWELADPVAAILEESGDDARALHARGVAHLVVRESQEAVAQLTAAVNKRPSDAAYWNDLAVAEVASGHGQRALVAADHALVLSPNFPDALFNRAVALQMLYQNDKARVAYERYLAMDATSKWAAEARGRIAQLTVDQ